MVTNGPFSLKDYGKNIGLSFVYLCIFRAFFRDVLKEPNLRFESAQMTLSKRLFDKVTLFLRVVNKNNKLNPALF